MTESGLDHALCAPLRLRRPHTKEMRAGGVALPQDNDLAAILATEGLAPLWSDLAEETPALVSSPLRDALKRQRTWAAVRYLLQRRSAARVGACLAAAGIDHALIKGAAVRELLYADPAVRPAQDVDILVGPCDRDRALDALVRDGLDFCATRANLSHEATLLDGRVAIDLHWEIFRPGRSRLAIGPLLLERAQTRADLPMLCDSANLLIALTHPAFAKHVNGCESKLIRVIDLDRMLRLTVPDWDWVLRLIETAGLRVAAWAVLHWTRSLLDTPVDARVLRCLEPGRFQRRYLSCWIDRRLTARLRGVPALVQGAFTLALHERPRDALRASLGLVQAHRCSGAVLRHLTRLTESAAARCVADGVRER